MKTKLLCMTILVLTVLIFGANHYASRHEFQDEGCEKCDCFALVTLKNPNRKQEPSCSVVFRDNSRRSSSDRNLKVYPIPKGPPTYGPGSQIYMDLSACDYVLFCDKDTEAQLSCRKESESNPAPLGSPEGWSRIRIWSEQRCAIVCENRGGDKNVRIGCNHWERPPPPVSEPPAKKSRSGAILSMFLESSWRGFSLVPSFVPTKYTEDSPDSDESRQIISDFASWRLIEGEAGLEQGMLMVTKGEAQARSFCTGDTFRLVGPNLISLPTCQPEFTGRWQGAYARALANGTRAAMTVSLTLRKESGSLRGELTTSDGTFNIVGASQSGTNINLQAERTVAGTQSKITVNGKLTKGEILFEGREQSSGTAITYGITGFFRRLYIAESGLPFAVLNQPYRFMLTALSPNSTAIRFRLASPAPKQPEQITWTTEAQSLRGRNGERFTYLCPPNGSLGRLYSRDNAYTDTSSICTAAVNGHVIDQQAGGVVTIEIRPGPSPDTGRFVFVAGEPQTGISGRLPRGLIFDSQSGTFSGTPTELGSFDITVVADDGAGNVFEQPLTIMVKKLVVTNGLLPDGFVGQPYAATLKVAGGQPPYRFSGNVPEGLHLDPVTGALSGKPLSASNAKTFEVVVRDSQNNSETQNVILRVRGATIMNSHFLPDAQVGVPYQTQFQVAGNLTPMTWVFARGDGASVGLTLNAATGELSGTPIKAGNFTIEVRAQGQSSSPPRTFALTVATQPGIKAQ